MEARIQAFELLSAEAASCCLCPRMEGRTAVLSQRNGSLRPRVMFIAEAPGRRGGDRTRVPMSGDASGVAFHRLMASAGLAESDIFITNAAMCNPRTASGANRTPTTSELRNCNGFLRRTIELLDPPLVVSIGASALRALGWIDSHDLTLTADVGKVTRWYGRSLIPLYHPSPQVLISRRSLETQLDDWQSIRAFLDANELRI